MNYSLFKIINALYYRGIEGYASCSFSNDETKTFSLVGIMIPGIAHVTFVLKKGEKR